MAKGIKEGGIGIPTTASPNETVTDRVVQTRKPRNSQAKSVYLKFVKPEHVALYERIEKEANEDDRPIEQFIVRELARIFCDLEVQVALDLPVEGESNSTELYYRLCQTKFNQKEKD